MTESRAHFFPAHGQKHRLAPAPALRGKLRCRVCCAAGEFKTSMPYEHARKIVA